MIVRSHTQQQKNNADAQIYRLTAFIKRHNEYRQSIPPGLHLPKSVATALDRILSEAVKERTRWENVK